MNTESFENRATEGLSNKEAYISAWRKLAESSFLDQDTKNKLLDIIRSAEDSIGNQNKGVEMDKIGERLVTLGFLYERSHNKEDGKEMRALVDALNVEMARAHRALLDKG